MSKVLLIRPLCEGDEPEFAEPLGIERLAGYLRAHGILDVEVFDRRLYAQEKRVGVSRSRFWQDVRAACASEPPDLVGLSLMTSADVPDALRLQSRMRTWWPQTAFSVGGLYVTTALDEARRRFPRGTVLQQGEGEASLLALAIGQEHDSSALSPDDWALPYRPYVERYAALGCAVNIQTSRGCPGACAFCATPQLPAGLRRWKPRDLVLVVDEVEYEARRLEAVGLPPIFNAVDDDFGPLARVEAFAKELARRELRVAFSLEMRLAALIGQPNLAERLCMLHEAGLTRVFFGVESLNPKTLECWHKPYDVSALPQVLDAFSRAGVEVQAGYILWHARQTVEGARAEVRALHELGIYSHRAAMSRLIVFPGCELAQHATQMGLESLDPEADAFYHSFCDKTSKLTDEWTKAAIALPHASAKAHLTGDCKHLLELRQALNDVNELSYAFFFE